MLNDRTVIRELRQVKSLLSRTESRIMPTDSNYLSTGMAAKALGISTDAVRKRIARGQIQAEKKNGEYRIHKNELFL